MNQNPLKYSFGKVFFFFFFFFFPPSSFPFKFWPKLKMTQSKDRLFGRHFEKVEHFIFVLLFFAEL